MRSRLTLWVLVGLFCASPAAAQLASQTALVGTVTDSAGLVVPGAPVVAVNTGTQDTYGPTTNAEGYYNIQFVRIGTYDITVTLTGFQTFKATGVEVASNQVVRTNAVLKVGGVTESVKVEATAPVLEHRPRHDFGDDRPAGDRRSAARTAATSGAWRARRPACSAASTATSA